MSLKRQTTGDHQRREDSEMDEDDSFADRDKVDPVKLADASTMAKRKIAKPRARRNIASSSSATSNPSSAPNPFNPFGSLASSTSSSAGTSTSVGFGTVGASTGANMGFGSGFGTTTASSATNNTTTASASSTASTSDKNKLLELRALNESFSKKIEALLKENVYADWSVVVAKYKDYASKVASSEEPGKPQFSLSSASKEAPGSIFGFKTNDTSNETKAKDTSKEIDTKDTDTKDSSDSDMDESDIEIKGPKFTLEKPPLTNNSPFDFTKPVSSAESSGPGFVFKSESKPSSVFKFDVKPDSNGSGFGSGTTTGNSPGETQTETPAEAPSEAPSEAPAEKPKFQFGNAESKPLFGSGDSKPLFGTSESKPLFGGSESKPLFGTSESKPLFGSSDSKPPVFNFGAKPSTESAETSGEKSGEGSGDNATDSNGPKSTPFSFASPANQTWSPDKGIKFGSASNAESTANATSGGFSFGQKPFSFGNTSTNEPIKFGAQSTGFSFAQSAPSGASNGASNEAADGAATDNADGDAEGEKDVQVDLAEKGPGEEDEDVVYEKKAKIFELVDGNFTTLGVGILRVLSHKETKKSRILVRTEGAGRVLLNVLLRSQLKYPVEGKGQVRVMDFKADGKPSTYVIRVKTEEDGKALSESLESHKG